MGTIIALHGVPAPPPGSLMPAAVARYLFADGPPCVTPFVDHTALFAGR